MTESSTRLSLVMHFMLPNYTIGMVMCSFDVITHLLFDCLSDINVDGLISQIANEFVETYTLYNY